MDGKALAEKVNAEADAAEAESPDDEPDMEGEEQDAANDQAEPDSQLPPPPEVDYEKRNRQLERAATTYEKAVQKAMGDDFELLEQSPLDDIPGYVFPIDPLSPVADAKRQAVAAYFGSDEPPYKDAPDRERCPTCDGWGGVLSGAQKVETRVVECPACSAMGYRLKAGAQSNYTVTIPDRVDYATGEIHENGQGSPDAFGRPHNHPDFGKMPAYDPASGTVR